MRSKCVTWILITAFIAISVSHNQKARANTNKDDALKLMGEVIVTVALERIANYLIAIFANFHRLKKKI